MVPYTVLKVVRGKDYCNEEGVAVEVVRVQGGLLAGTPKMRFA